ncbi:LamG-like jellyroll fold domain-containing protein [Bacteroidota bacterium]
MKKLVLLLFVSVLITDTIAQNVGDTIEIETFNYAQTLGFGIRDTVIDFSVLPDVSFEKVLMLYNMRCKDANVSLPDPGLRNFGCGEWDYSCATFLHDSSQIDSVLSFTPSYSVSGFSGSSYSYTETPVYNYIQTQQQNVTVNSIISEDVFSIGSGSLSLSHTIPTDKKSSKSQYLFTASELSFLYFMTPGEINALALNVLSGNANANFLRIRIKHTTANTLSSTTPDISGFTEVYYHNTSFATGDNKIQFYTPFDWDGTSNLIIEFSFTNSTPGTAVTFEGSQAGDSLGMYNNNDVFVSVNGAESIEIPTSNMSTVSDEITVTFWSYGNENILTTNNCVVESMDIDRNRSFNVHLPWSNSRVYFDCGGNGTGGYDRIDKAAIASEFAGYWNHWAFTKNTTTGNMKIYHNGSLWHSGIDKTNLIDIQALRIASNKTGNGNFYSGKIDEFCMFDVELTETEINEWMNKNIDATHPKYDNLIAYYPLDEGTGSTSLDNSSAALIGTFQGNIEWQFNRGDKISRFFQVTNERPNIKLYQGSYNLTTTEETVYDSILVTPNTVEELTIIKRTGFLHDSIAAVSTNLYWIPQSVTYDEDGTELSSTEIAIDGTIEIGELRYYRKYPAKFEIMSFVTPYGIYLDLGMGGKTWTFDVTDYLPVFTGLKRMTVERGGQWQEDMDIRFLFIVGTPPRDVLGINQLWTTDAKSYTEILNDRAYERRNVLLDPNGVSFKIRTDITGHGQEGEFVYRNHYVTINGMHSFNWEVKKECADNPVYPQGGTWIYDRAGWCPGAPTDVRHNDITPYVTPGEEVLIDYSVVSGSGDSRYHSNNQLVTYGEINHTLDAAVLEVREPSNRIEFQRFNSICHDPKIVIQNTGSTELASLIIDYWMNDATTHMVYNWTGNLNFLETDTVALPSSEDLWEPATPTGNVFHVEISSPNGETDEYIYNNNYNSAFTLREVMPELFYIEFKTNTAGHESSYELLDATGNIIFSNYDLESNTTYNDLVELDPGCYSFHVYDTDDDGIDFWANNDGIGYVKFIDDEGATVKSFDGDFGDNINFNFAVDHPISYNEIHKVWDIQLFPNPASYKFTIEGKDVHETKTIIFTDNLGKAFNIPVERSKNQLIFNTSGLIRGIYYVKFEHNGTLKVEKLIVD